jgi:hypothetical protein
LTIFLGADLGFVSFLRAFLASSLALAISAFYLGVFLCLSFFTASLTAFLIRELALS